MQIKLLNSELIEQIKDLFDAQMSNPVELLYFSTKDHCETCDETRQLLDEIASISDKLYVSNFDIDENPQLAQKYNVRLTPGLVIAAREADKLLDYGIRFAGIPSGYEFSSFLQSIILVSKRNSGLKPAIRNQLNGLMKPVQLHVFVTPT